MPRYLISGDSKPRLQLSLREDSEGNVDIVTPLPGGANGELVFLVGLTTNGEIVRYQQDVDILKKLGLKPSVVEYGTAKIAEDDE